MNKHTFQPLRRSHFDLCMMMSEWSAVLCAAHPVPKQ